MGHYRLELRSAGRGVTVWIFLAPSDEAAALTGPYRCQADLWPDGTAWEVSRYDPLTVDADGQTATAACIGNMVGSGEYER